MPKVLQIEESCDVRMICFLELVFWYVFFCAFEVHVDSDMWVAQYTSACTMVTFPCATSVCIPFLLILRLLTCASWDPIPQTTHVEKNMVSQNKRKKKVQLQK